MDATEISYFLGIDGGGTKTEFLLTDLECNELERIILCASNPVNLGIDNTFRILEQGIMQVCRNVNRSEISAYAGLAGGISGNNRELIKDFLSGFGFGAADNGSDTDNALEMALCGKDGAVVITGTGIVAFSQSNGIRQRIGGWGYLIDKGGSGFSFGSDALNSAFECYDGRGGSAVIMNLVQDKINKPLPECISDIYSSGAAAVASFASVVFDAYRQGDETAEKIIDRNAYEIAKLINTCCKNLTDENKKVVLCGGMCRNQDILKPFITKHLKADCIIEFSTEPMVNGAVLLAKANINKNGE